MAQFTLTNTAWVRIAAAGSCVDVQNRDASGILIATSATQPAMGTDGEALYDYSGSRQFGAPLPNDLWAIAITATGSVEVMAIGGGADLALAAAIGSPGDPPWPGSGPGTLIAISKAIWIKSGGTSASAANTAAPTISGTSQVGQTLMASPGTWTGAPASYAYQWAGNGTAIAGATASTYAPASSDIGATLTVTVTATNAGGSVGATSAATAVVSGAPTGGAADFSQSSNSSLIAAIAA